jgi:aconitate decarboxylase
MTMTERFADCILDICFDELPPAAIDVAKAVALDGVAVTLAGATEPLGLGRIVTEYVRQLGGAPEATVLAGGFQTAMPNAAFANGTMAHALDFDNTWYPLNHPTSPTLPAILAIGEARESPGRAIIEAIVTAFEVQARLRLAATDWTTGHGFHKPGVTGVMGATAGAARLLGLNRNQLVMALGAAGSRAGSLAINTGTMTKSSHAGHAARMGVECALLAGMGWTATSRLFDAGGFFESFTGGPGEPELMLADFGQPYRMVEPGVGFKKHPCNYFTHRPIDAALVLRAQHRLDPENIVAVDVRFPPFEYVDRPEPASGLDGKFSVQYTTAVALLDGLVTVDSFTNERRFAPDMLAFLPRVRLRMDPAIPADFATMHVELSVRLDDGQVLTRHQAELSGYPGQPLSRAERVAKFEACAQRAIDADGATRALVMVENLENQPNVRELMWLLRDPVLTTR